MKMPVKNVVKSKAMIAGFGLVALGVYIVIQGQSEVGMGVVLNGLGYIGVRDAQHS